MPTQTGMMMATSILSRTFGPIIGNPVLWRTQQWISFSTAAGVHSSTEAAGNVRLIHFGRKAASLMLFGLTGAFALSALDDYAIYHDCSSKAIEKATHNQSLKEALGEPIVRGWWYNASLAVAHQKRSASCTFPIFGAQGSGIIQLKAIRHGENSFFTFLGSQEWEIILSEALIHIPANEESKRTLRINLMEHSNLPGIKDCKECQLGKPLNSKNDLDMQIEKKKNRGISSDPRLKVIKVHSEN